MMMERVLLALIQKKQLPFNYTRNNILVNEPNREKPLDNNYPIEPQEQNIIHNAKRSMPTPNNRKNPVDNDVMDMV